MAEGAKAKWTRKSNLPEVTKSWHDYQVVVLMQEYHAVMCCLYLTNYVQIREVVRDFQHQVLQAHEQPYNEDTCAQIPQVSQGFQYFITSSCDVYNVHCNLILMTMLVGISTVEFLFS